MLLRRSLRCAGFVSQDAYSLHPPIWLSPPIRLIWIIWRGLCLARRLSYSLRMKIYSAGTLVQPNTEELISELLVGQKFWRSLTGHKKARYIAWFSWKSPSTHFWCNWKQATIKYQYWFNSTAWRPKLAHCGGVSEVYTRKVPKHASLFGSKLVGSWDPN